MHKVFITGRGLVTPLGIGLEANLDGLLNARSGIVNFTPFIEHGLPSQVAGKVPGEVTSPLIDRKTLRYCPPNGVFSVVAVQEALKEAGINNEDIPELKIAVIGGVAGSYFSEVHANAQNHISHGNNIRYVSPFIVPMVMPSSAVSNLSLLFGFTGESYDISAACSSGALAIMTASRLIQCGLYDIVVAGGAEQLDWVQAVGFTAARALAKSYNDCPEQASRPFDRNRDGFVLGEGAGFVVLESENSIRRRGAKPISRLSGFGANSNAKDMLVPDPLSGAEVMVKALNEAGLKSEDVTYINTHGTATKVGDPVELEAIKSVFGDKIAINSTKSQTGHLIGATGAVEIIYTTLMQQHRFLSKSLNFETPDEGFEWGDFVRERRDNVLTQHAISNNFAFGGSNVSSIITDCINFDY